MNSAVVQEIVGRYADGSYAIDFDCYVGCLIRLEMLFSESRDVTSLTGRQSDVYEYPQSPLLHPAMLGLYGGDSLRYSCDINLFLFAPQRCSELLIRRTRA